MRAKPIAVLTLLVTGCAVPVAVAAPPWSPPRDVSAVVAGVSLSAIGFGGDGTALLSWNEFVTRPGRTPAPLARFARLLPDGSVAERGSLPRALAIRPVVYGRNRTVVLEETRRLAGGRDFRSRVRLDATFGTTDRPLGRRPRRVAAFRDTGGGQGPAIAASAQGEVAVAWVELHGRTQDEFVEYRVRVAISRGGRGFGRPQTLAASPIPTQDSQSVALAYGARGELLIAYSTARRMGRRLRPLVAARTRRGGRAFGRPQVLGTRQPLTDLAAVAAPNGRMVVAWGSQDSGEEASRPWIVRAALRPRAQGPFGRAVVLDPGETPERVPGRLAAAMALDGSATLAWSNARGRAFPLTYPVRTASIAPTGGFGPVTQLAATGIVGDVAVARDGTTLVSWTETAAGDDPDRTQPAHELVALRPAGKAIFGAPERVSSPELDDRAAADFAFDPLTSRPSVVWPAANLAVDPQLPDSARLKLSTRTG